MSRIHWLTPMLMTGAVLLGLLFALGHHFFYASLHGTEAPSVSDEYHLFGASFSEQRTNTAIGTAFAFLVRACLIFGISLAYLQAVLWSAARENKRGVTVAHLDVLMSALGNLLALGTLSVWVRRPVLLLIAVMAWLIPIASIVTPATLSIGTHTAPSEFRPVPQIAFNSLNLLAEMPYVAPMEVRLDCAYRTCDYRDYLPRGTEADYVYSGPSNAVRRLALATAAQGGILNIKAPAPNSSWMLEFPAPALQCGAVDRIFARAIQQNILDYTLVEKNCSAGPGFLSWRPALLPASPQPIIQMLPYLETLINGSHVSNSDLSTERDPASTLFFIATTPSLMAMNSSEASQNPRVCHPTGPINLIETFFGPDASPPSTILECDLHNSTYHAEFSYVNGVQQVRVVVSDISPMPLTSQSKVRSLWKNSSLYQDDLMSQPCDYFADYESTATTCEFDTTLLQTLSYQAIFNAFAELLIGSVQWDSNYKSGRGLSTDSKVISTVLTTAPELAWMDDFNMASKNGDMLLQDVQPVWKGGEVSKFAGWKNRRNATSEVPLHRMLEELFVNVTISLMSQESLQYNKSSPFYPPPTNVTFSMRTNIYVYPAFKLWLAYGLAIGVTALIVCFGLAAIIINDASFSYQFSTLLRLSRGAELSGEVKQEDLDGKDPLPRYLKELNVRFWSEKREEQCMEEEKLAGSEVVDGEADQIESARFGDEVHETGGADRERSVSR